MIPSDTIYSSNCLHQVSFPSNWERCSKRKCFQTSSVDLTPLTWSTNRVKSMGQSIIDQSVNKGQRGQSHVAHAICKPIRLCTWASKCTCNMKELQRKFYWLAFSCSHLNMPPKSLLWEHFYTNSLKFKGNNTHCNMWCKYRVGAHIWTTQNAD